MIANCPNCHASVDVSQEDACSPFDKDRLCPSCTELYKDGKITPAVWGTGGRYEQRLHRKMFTCQWADTKNAKPEQIETVSPRIAAARFVSHHCDLDFGYRENEEVEDVLVDGERYKIRLKVSAIAEKA